MSCDKNHTQEEAELMLQNNNKKVYCFCQLKYYKLRPHALNLIRAIRSQFELVACADIPFEEIDQIICKIEYYLNQKYYDEKIKASV